MEKKISWNKIKLVVKGWRTGDYFRQFSIVAGGVIVTFWGSNLITEHGRQKEVQATMQLVTEELEHNREELHRIKRLLDIDVHMAMLLREKNMKISDIPEDTLKKYGKFFSNMDYLNYSADALDVMKGSSLMQYIGDKRLLQDVLRTYLHLGKIQKEIGEYYGLKSGVLMDFTMASKSEEVLSEDRQFKDNIADLMEHDKFVNYAMMVPGFLNWGDFDFLDKMLTEQIQTLKTEYQ